MYRHQRSMNIPQHVTSVCECILDFSDRSMRYIIQWERIMENGEPAVDRFHTRHFLYPVTGIRSLPCIRDRSGEGKTDLKKSIYIQRGYTYTMWRERWKARSEAPNRKLYACVIARNACMWDSMIANWASPMIILTWNMRWEDPDKLKIFVDSSLFEKLTQSRS